MKLLAAGGGSGGHVVPLLAVINELSKHDSSLRVTVLTDKKFGAAAADILSHAAIEVETRTIASGKLRRYHTLSIWYQLFRTSVVIRNIGDAFLVLVGYLQSVWLMLRERPDVVFAKGGFVCLPVGMAASTLRIPLVIHDSDSRPGLTNRLLAPRATRILTGAPLENYPYGSSKSRDVGIPVDSHFHPVTSEQQRKLKSALGLPDITWPLVVVTGGGQGAERINDAMALIAEDLMAAKIAVVHVTGQKQFDRVSGAISDHPCYIIKPFVDDGMYRLLGAADVVVTRAGATALAEIAAMARPTIIIPNPRLTGGHQLKNSEVYTKAKAAMVIDEALIEKRPARLLKLIKALLDKPKEATAMAERLHAFAKPDSALIVATEIAEVYAAHQTARAGQKE